MSEAGVLVGLSAVIVTVRYGQPCVFIVRGAEHGIIGAPQHSKDAQEDALPFGAFDPNNHRTLELGVRSWVKEQTPLNIGHVEQLYTFGNRGRYEGQAEDSLRVMSVSYLVLTHEDVDTSDRVFWGKWYTYFPWEDWREGKPEILDKKIIPALMAWCNDADGVIEKEQRKIRVNRCFGLNGLTWDNESVLQRYELLYEAYLIPEASRDENKEISGDITSEGRIMQYDHRRILATAISRLRGKLKYRPVIFELMSGNFTLLELQRTVEAVSGHCLHKQNFRRLVEKANVVEETGETTSRAGGRPAALFRFRDEVMQERYNFGVTISSISNAS